MASFMRRVAIQSEVNKMQGSDSEWSKQDADENRYMLVS
jgi:hypothetical protein